MDRVAIPLPRAVFICLKRRLTHCVQLGDLLAERLRILLQHSGFSHLLPFHLVPLYFLLSLLLPMSIGGIHGLSAFSHLHGYLCNATESDACSNTLLRSRATKYKRMFYADFSAASPAASNSGIQRLMSIERYGSYLECENLFKLF